MDAADVHDAGMDAADVDDAGMDAADVDDAGADAALDCEPGAKRCAGLVPETCDASGAWVAGAACEFVCDEGACTGACVPGAQRCTGTQPEVCSAAGMFENAGDVCEFVCTAGVCEGACVPGSKRCAGNAVELCDATGTFVADETCTQLCDEGACVCDPDYSGDGYDCEPLDFCDASRGGCGPNAICTQVGVTPACACNDGYEGAGLACAVAPTADVLVEGFDDITTLPSSGWIRANRNAPNGSPIPGPITDWFQGKNGTIGYFAANDGDSTAYVAADYTTGANAGTANKWLITPEIDFGDAATLSFFSRTRNGNSYPDRLEVRVCTTLPCDAPGAYPDVSGYETVLRSINPDLVSDVYPYVWTQYTLTNADGIPHHGRGRIAFRYFVTGAGQSGTNGDYIGIDTVRYRVGAASYEVGGTISFVGGAQDVTVSLNRQVSLPITSSGAFSIPATLSPGTPYVITVQDAPAGTVCEVTNGTGVMGTAAVANVSVSCVAE